jgi:hypothetical protein
MLLPASRTSRNDTAAVQLLSSITAVALELGSVGSDGTVTAWRDGSVHVGGPSRRNANALLQMTVYTSNKFVCNAQYNTAVLPDVPLCTRKITAVPSTAVRFW